VKGEREAFLESLRADRRATVLAPGSVLLQADCLEWLETVPAATFHAVITDPPYGLVEYDPMQQEKLRRGRGGVWRIPPRLGGAERAPVPRFTILSEDAREELGRYLLRVGRALYRVCVPGAHVFLASQPLLSSLVFTAFAAAGWEKRGEIIRLVQTLRGGDRPKGAESEFLEVSVMPRSCWEPWGLFRKPCEGAVAENLRRWGTGALRRPATDAPFRDVIPCAPTHASERRLAPHPSLKPQRFLRRLAHAALPCGTGLLLDPFAGSGALVAAAAWYGYPAVGVERDPSYVELARRAFPRLAELNVPGPPGRNA